MKPIKFHTVITKLLSDIHTPVGIYLRLRDNYRDTILLESADYHVGENSFSILGINAIAGIEINAEMEVEVKLPGNPAKKLDYGNKKLLTFFKNF